MIRQTVIRRPGAEKPWAVIGAQSGIIFAEFYHREDAYAYLEFTAKQRETEAAPVVAAKGE